MTATKRERLLAAGWREGTAQELLGLTDEEMEIVESRRRKTIQVETKGPRGEPYLSDDGGIGEFVTYLLSMLDEQRDKHPGERADCIGLHPVIFDRIYQHVHGSLASNRNAIRATRRVGDDYEAIWLHPEPEITDVRDVLFGRRRVE
jgi:hypothetical protein